MSLIRYRISPEGYIYILIACAAGAAAYHYDLHPIVLIAVAAIVSVLLYIFRDSIRSVPSLPLGVIAPIDGEVTHIGQTSIEGVGDDALLIKIRGNVLGSYILRGPTEGKLNKYWRDGSRQYFCIQTDEGDNVAVGLDVGLFGKKPRIRAAVGERVGQGRRFGFIPIAGDVCVVVAGAHRLDVAEGQRVRSGETVVATIRH